MMSIVEFLSQPLWQRLGLTLMHFLWQGLAIAVLAALLVRVFRLKHGNARYGAYVLAYIAMVICPVATFTVIDIPLSQNTAFVMEAELAEIVDRPTYTTLPAVDVLPEAKTPNPVATEPTAANTIPLGERLSGWLDVSMPWVLVIWIVGVIALSVRLLMGFIGVYRWRHNLEPLPEKLAVRVTSLSDALGMGRFSWVFVSPTVLQAMAVGYFRPMVLLPAAMVAQMQPEMLEAVIAHELAHIRRFDLWINLAQRITETLLFYHPAVWWLSDCLRSERELCCDELAVKATGERLTYATTLQSVSQTMSIAKQPILATGLGQDKKPTLGRVRHILGLKPAQRNCPYWLAGVIAVLFVVALAIPTTLALTNLSDENSVSLESEVLEGIAANRDKFECGILAWSNKRINESAVDRIDKKLTGQYELWWDGKKLATKYVHDQVHVGPEGNRWVERQQGSNSYDGGVLSRKPDFHVDDWLGPNVTRWREGGGSQDWRLEQDSKYNNISRSWSVIDGDDGKLIRVISRNMRETDRDYKAYGIRDFDPSKGHGLVYEEWFNPDGSTRMKHTVKLSEVISGGWFPVEVNFKSARMDDGVRVDMHNNYTLDMERCSFNDREALPDRIFKFSEDKQLKYQQKLQEYLAMELRGLSKAKEAVKDDEVRLGAREAVEKFIAAAMAGDFETGRQFAHPDKAPYDQIEDIPEVLKGQNLWLMAVLADDSSAIAVSSVIRADNEIGPLVFFLDRVSQDGQNHWWVHDIDMESPDSVEAELKQFLEKHPEAKMVAAENKPALQDKNQRVDIESLLNKIRKAQRPAKNMIVEWQDESPSPAIVTLGAVKPDFLPPSRISKTYKAIIAGEKSRIEERELTFQSEKDTEPSKTREITYVFDGTVQKKLDHRVKGYANKYRGSRYTYDKNTQLLSQLLVAYQPFLNIPRLLEEYDLKVVENKETGLITLETSKENSAVYRFTIDPDKGYNIVKHEVILLRGKDYEINCIIEKQANGLWYQTGREKVRYDRKTGKPRLENKVRITKLDFNPEIPTDAFELEFPKGTRVWDGKLKDWIIINKADTSSHKTTVQVDGQSDWGEAVEGVQIRVRPKQQILLNGNVPKFTMDIRNKGTVEWDLVLAWEHWQVEIDGAWYKAGAAFDGDVPKLRLAPGAEQKGIEFSPEERSKWNNKGKALIITPGQHEIRLAFGPSTTDLKNWRRIRVVSNPVLIEVEKARQAKVKGQVLIGADSQPIANQQVFLQVFVGGDTHDDDNYRYYNTVTNSDGQFVFENVDSGSAQISRLYMLGDTGGGANGLYHNFEIKPDKEYSITLGGKGRPVIGKLVPASGNKDDIDWTIAKAGLSLEFPHVMMINDNQKIVHAMEKSEGGNFYHKAQIKINPDGTFRVDNVRAGQYLFRVSLPGDNFEGYNLSRKFTVNLMSDGTTKELLNLGDLVVSHGSHSAPKHIDNLFLDKFELNKVIPVILKAGTDQHPAIVSTKSIKFEKDGESVKATLKMEWLTIADAKWQATLHLQDKNSSILTRDDIFFETSRIFKGVAARNSESLYFTLGPLPDLSKAKHFVLTIKPTNEQLELNVQDEVKPQEPEKPMLIWGEEVNGLRAAVEFLPEKESYALEEVVEVRFHVENVSSEDVEFSTESTRQDWATVKDSDGKEVKVDGAWHSGTVSTRRHIIKPGQILALKTTGLQFGDFHDPAILVDKPKGPYVGSLARCGPGQYSVYYKINPALNTGTRKVTVNERPPVDPRSFELTLDQQSIMQAVQTLRRKYRARICFEQAGSETESKQNLITSTFFAPTIPELLDKLTETGLYKWEKFNRTYVVYPKHNSILRFYVKTDISDKPLESVARAILDQNSKGKQVEIEAVNNGIMRNHLWISKHYAMYALSRAAESIGLSVRDVVWTLTFNQSVPRLSLHRLSQAPQTN